MSISADTLQSLEGFRKISRRAAQALVEHARLRSYGAGEPLFREGGASNGIFVVLEGEVRVVRTSRGRRHVLHTERRGGTLGEAPFFDRAPYPASAIAWTAVEALYIDGNGLESAVRTTPDVALFFLARLAGRVRILLDRVDRLATADVGTRLCAYLLDEVERTDGTIVAITQASLAEELGTVREVVMRTLRSLRSQRIIGAAGRGRIEIIDRLALRKLAAG